MIRVLLILVFAAAVARAVNSIEQDFTCPFDGHTWKQRMETSAEVKGMRLDLRQLGDVVQPPTLPQCPKCRAVLFADKFERDLVLALKPFIEMPDFAHVAKKFPSYYVLAQIQQRLKAPPYHIGHSYLRAAWQAEAKPAIAQHCLVQAQEFLTAAFQTMEPDHKHYANTALLLGEFERRLGQFENANVRFRKLMDLEVFKQPGFQLIIARQMELIAKRDSAPHGILAAHDALLAAPPTSLTNSKPAPAGTAPVPRADYTAQSLEAISAATEAAPKPKPKARKLGESAP